MVALRAGCRAGAVLLVLGIALASPARAESDGLAPQTVDECLLEGLRKAAADTTVGQLRARCARPENPEGTAVTPVIRSPITDRRARESRLWTERFALMPHRPNYLLPYTRGRGFRRGDPALDRAELMMQLSFKLPITVPTDTGRPSFFVAYTGQAWWQAYNADQSRPFREYDHIPEAWFELQPDHELALGWTLRTVRLGLEHHSNGRSTVASRSWNKVFAQFEADQGAHWWSQLRLWERVGERAKQYSDDPRGDDNPDITRYYGHFEWHVGYRGDRWQWSLMARRSTSARGHGAWQAGISRPTGFNPKARWYLSWFDGYGESLIDYDARVRRIGFGLMINDWF